MSGRGQSGSNRPATAKAAAEKSSTKHQQSNSGDGTRTSSATAGAGASGSGSGSTPKAKAATSSSLKRTIRESSRHNAADDPFNFPTTASASATNPSTSSSPRRTLALPSGAPAATSKANTKSQTQSQSNGSAKKPSPKNSTPPETPKPDQKQGKQANLSKPEKQVKIVIVSEDEDDIEFLEYLDTDTDDSDDEDFKEGKAFDVLEVAKTFYKKKVHRDDDDDEGDNEDDEDDDDDENDGSQDDNNEDGGSPPKRRRASGGGRKKKEKAPKSEQGTAKASKKAAAAAALTRKKNIEIRKGLDVPIIAVNESHEPDVSCCLVCSSREFMRAAEHKDLELLKALLLRDDVGSWYYANSPDNPMMNPLTKAVALDFDEFIHVLFNRESIACKNIDPPRVYIDAPGTTGHQNYRTYGRAIKKVNESRGNREGNNAFYNAEESSIFDFDKRGTPIEGEKSVEGYWRHAMRYACRLPYSEKTFDRLLSFQLDQSELGEWALYEAVIAGNRKLASKMLTLMTDFGGFFNTLHHEALSLEPGTPFTPFRAVSVLKKSNRELHYVKPLHFSAINPDPERLATLLDAISPAAALETDELGRSVVHFAAVCEGTGPLNLLKERGFDLRALDACKMNPLLLAAKYGRVDNVKFLLDAMGGGSEAANATFLPNAFTALHFASGLGHYDVVELLLDEGATVDIKDKRDKSTPLIHACKAGHLEIVKLLVSKGADLFAVDNMGRTPLIHACKNGHADIAIYLLSEGADAEATDTSQNSVLHYACGYGWKEIAKILLEYGKASLNPLNSWKCSPLMTADLKGHFGLVQYLLGLPGIGVNFLDKNGYSLLHLAFKSQVESPRDFETAIQKITTLLRHGAGPNQLSVQANTPLHMMVEWAFNSRKFSVEQINASLVRCFALLLENGALLETANRDNATPLALAIANSRFALAAEMLKAGALVENVRYMGSGFIVMMLSALARIDSAHFSVGEPYDAEALKKAAEGAADLERQADAVLNLLTNEKNRDQVASQLLQVDALGYSPILLSVSKAVASKSSEVNNLVTALHQSARYVTINNMTVKKVQNINLDRKYTCLIKGLKKLLDVIPPATQKTVLTAKVQVPRNFVKANPSVPNPPNTGYTVLHFAAQSWDTVLVSEILGVENSLVDDRENDTGATPLNIALKSFASVEKVANTQNFKFIGLSDLQRQLATVKALLEAGANPMLNDKEGKSAVFRVLENLPTESHFNSLSPVLRDLVGTVFDGCAGKDASELNVLSKGDTRSTVLILALEKRYYKFASAIVQAGASLNVIGPNGVSTALSAFRTGRVEAAKIVLAGDLSIPDNDGRTCLIEACYGSDELASVLLSADGPLNINHADKEKQTALMVAVRRKRSANILENLIAAGADVNIVGPSGKTALIFGVEAGLDESVAILVNHGADVNVQDTIPGCQQSALHYAVLSRNKKIVAKLLEAGADPKAIRGKDLATPLHVAVEESKKEVNKSLKIERALLQFGAPINATDAQGRTPLHIAFFGLGVIPKMEMTAAENRAREDYEKSVKKHTQSRDELTRKVTSIMGNGSEAATSDTYKWFLEIKGSLEENKVTPIEDKRSTASEFMLGVMDTSSAVVKSDPVEIVDFLVTQDGISPDTVDKFGRAPVHYAALIGASSCTNSLLKAGVDLERPDSDGNTPIQLSLLGDHVDFFLNIGLQGAFVNGKLILANGASESNFYYALMKNYMSIGYFIKNREKQNICVAISDSLRTGRYSLALSLASSADIADLKVTDEQNRNMFHVIGDFHAGSSAIEWEEEYAPDLFEIVKDVGLDVNARDEEGRTPLICAAQHGQTAILKMLLSVPEIGLDICDNSGCTALLRATLSSSMKAVNELLSAGASVDIGSNLQQFSLVRAAVNTRHMGILTAILNAGAAVDAEEPPKKASALLKAVSLGDSKIVSKLIEWGVSLNKPSFMKMKDDSGKDVEVQTQAICVAQGTVFEILVKSGVNVNARHPLTQRTCFMEAMDSGEKDSRWKVLLRSKPDVNMVDPKYKKSSFHRGVLDGLYPFKDLTSKIVESLKPDFSSTIADSGSTLIDYAVKTRNHSLLKQLLRLKADPNAISSPTANPERSTALMLAIRVNDFEAVKILCRDAATDVNTVDAHKRNCLHYAVAPFENASFENVDLIKYLCEQGAVLDAEDEFGKRPIDYATCANNILRDCLLALGSPDPIEQPVEDQQMHDAVVPVSDEDADASLERARLEAVAVQMEEERIRKLSRTRGVDISVIRAEEKKSKWAKVNSSANVDEAQVRVLFEGDGIDEYIPYDVLLHKCDVSRGIYGENKFYIMQILYNHLQDLHFLFNKWGDSSILETSGRRYSSGQFQKTPFNSREEAIAEFKKVFKSKSGNEWTGNPADFVEKPGKYCLVKKVEKLPIVVKPIDYKECPQSSLPQPVEEVLKMFLHVASLKPSTVYNDDVASSPLDGALDRGVIDKAFEVLLTIRTKFHEMNTMMKATDTIPSAKALLALREQLVILSTNYFRLVPSREGLRGLKPIMTADALGKEMMRINSLKQYDTGLKILFAASYNRLRYNPVDYTYGSLRTRMTPLESGPECDILMKWISQTSNGVDVLNVFGLDRDWESASFQHHHGNKRLLFHGSKMSNMLGILKHGLQVAPIEAPVTGYMFGKGIYFADTFCKSWSYVQDHVAGGSDISAYGCMFICEVALGNSWENESSQYMEEAKPGFSSTKGLGQKVPDPQQVVTRFKDNTKVPIGPLVTDALRKNPENKDIPRGLNYNEYIVYDPAQVRIRYLLVLRNNKMCHLCLRSNSLKKCDDYAENFEQWKNLPKTIPFESEVTQAIMQRKGFTGSTLWKRDFTEKVVKGKAYSKRWDPPTALDATSKICENCAKIIMMDLMEGFCGENRQDLPDELLNRPACANGRECTKQHETDHSLKFNHYCDKKSETENDKQSDNGNDSAEDDGSEDDESEEDEDEDEDSEDAMDE
ncbi:hypothetical protein HDU83_006579, partial [Entophlyctis luteolus]